MPFPNFKVGAVPYLLRRWCTMVTGPEKNLLVPDLQLAADLVEKLLAESPIRERSDDEKLSIVIAKVCALEVQVARLQGMHSTPQTTTHPEAQMRACARDEMSALEEQVAMLTERMGLAN